MADRQVHQQEVLCFLQQHFSVHDWSFSLPRGTGAETYVVRGDERDYFVKVGAPVERYAAMAEIGLTPSVLARGQLENGASIMVQPLIAGRMPSRKDYWNRLEAVAGVIREMHHHPRVRETLPPALSNLHKDAGLQVLNDIRQRWERYKSLVPNVARFVDDSLEYLAQQVNSFSGEGLVSSHNDICNANWLFASDGEIYIIDLDSMSADDPALDLGALLWWYYPPELRGRFLEAAGYRYDDEFKLRMQIRMAMHCLHITLPREESFDEFDPNEYEEWLTDFKAILNGKENPQGYSE
ncbi:MAG TPA: aminoglycoside phosphotransferase family protein [Anaerolineales bacterium]|nr:aminoglycoside phosphotransferase family protein [Anaerolineales bacterium]